MAFYRDKYFEAHFELNRMQDRLRAAEAVVEKVRNVLAHEWVSAGSGARLVSVENWLDLKDALRAYDEVRDQVRQYVEGGK